MLFRCASYEFTNYNPVKKDPLLDYTLMRGMANSPKELLRDYLKERKAAGKYSERDILDTMDRLRQFPADKEVEDILYALSDLAPSDGVRRKARDMIEERKAAK
jgi:hypothetical protein